MRYEIPQRFAKARMAQIDIEAVKSYAKEMPANLLAGRGLVLCGPPGVGKCLARGTKVLMHSGKLVAVEKVRVGDLLAAYDGGEPREVLGVNKGFGPLYKVIPTKGDSWVCNDQHILTALDTRCGKARKIVDFSVQEYMEMSDYSKLRMKLFQPPHVKFSPKNEKFSVDPYFLGVWLGDGGKTLGAVTVTKPDVEIKQACQNEATAWGLRLACYQSPGNTCPTYALVRSKGDVGTTNPLLQELKHLMRDGIRVPYRYKTASIATRRQVLAGLLDTDGHLLHAGGGYEIVQKEKLLAEDIAFLARSLGLRVTSSVKYVNKVPYYRLCLSGECDRLPLRIPRKQSGVRQQMKDARVTGFTIEPCGEGEFFGFTLDQDGRFCLGDFTVTHNSYGLAALTQYYKREAEKGGRYPSSDYIFITAPDMFDKVSVVGEALDEYRGQDWTTSFQTTPLLVINDLGKEYRGGKLEEQIPHKLGRVLRARSERELPVFVSTNLTALELRATYGESIVSILRESCRVVQINGHDRRLKAALLCPSTTTPYPSW